jgi:hypothetical protein
MAFNKTDFLGRANDPVILEQTYAAMRRRMRDFPTLRANYIDPKTGKLPSFMDPDLPENLKKDGLEE